MPICNGIILWHTVAVPLDSSLVVGLYGSGDGRDRREYTVGRSGH